MGTTIENKNKKKYVEPSLWVDSYTIERGFAASLALDFTVSEEGDRAVESREMSNGYFGAGFTAEQFVKYFEVNGCAFLPVTGYRVGETNVYYSSDRCFYWMGDLKRMNLDVANPPSEISSIIGGAGSTRSYGMGVRLVRVIE